MNKRLLLMTLISEILLSGTGCGDDLWISGESMSNGLNVVVHVLEEFTNRIEIYTSPDLISNVWTVAVENIKPSYTNPAIWHTMTGNSGFFYVGNMDVDTDGDTLCDARENFVHKTDPDQWDTDMDDLSDGAELKTHGTDPLKPDSDNDALPDGWEIDYGLNPLADDHSLDPDGDGLSHLEEYQAGTNPQRVDSDHDGLPDAWELQHNLNPNSAPGNEETLKDTDQDGLANIEEYQSGLNPTDADMDGDGFLDAFDYRAQVADYPILGEGVFSPVSTKHIHSASLPVATKITLTWGNSFWYPHPNPTSHLNMSAGSARSTPLTMEFGPLVWRIWNEWQPAESLSPWVEDKLYSYANGMHRNLIYEHQIEAELGYDIYVLYTSGYHDEFGVFITTNALCVDMSHEYETTASSRTVSDGPKARGYEDIYAYSDGGNTRSEEFNFVFNQPVTNRIVKWLTYQFDYEFNERYGYEVHQCVVNGMESSVSTLTSGFMTVPVLNMNGDFNLDGTVDLMDSALRANPNAALPLSVSPEISDMPSNTVSFMLDFPMQYTTPSSGLTLILSGVDSGERFRVWSSTNGMMEEPIGPLWVGGGDDPELIIDPPLLFDTDSETEYWWPISDSYEYTEFPKTLYIECLSVGATNDGLAELRVFSEYHSEELCSARLPVAVLNVDLDIDANFDASITDADDSIEESAGGVVGLNNDDDNGNSTADKDDTGTVGGENDLEPIGLLLEPASLSSGTLKLEAVSGGSKIKVWETTTKGTEVPLPKVWTLGTDTIPATLYVEGVQVSGTSPRDVGLKLVYENGTPVCDDQITLTVTTNAFQIFADQPGAGGDRDPYELTLSGADVGHTFWRFLSSHPSILPSALQAYANQYIGYYPATGVNPYTSPTANGLFVMPDTTHLAAHEVDYTWIISPNQLIDGLEYCEALDDTPGTYNLNTHNCTDGGINAGVAAGVSVSDTAGVWPGGGGSNPGDLGEDLRVLP